MKSLLSSTFLRACFALSVLLLCALSHAQAQTTLLTNGDFSNSGGNGTAPVGWTKDFNSFGAYAPTGRMTPHSAGYLLHAGNGWGTGGSYQDISTTAGKTYLVTLWMEGFSDGTVIDQYQRQQGALVIGGTAGTSSVTLGSSLLQTTGATTVAESGATVTNFLAVSSATAYCPWYQQASSFTATGATTRIGLYNVSTSNFKSAVNVDDVGVYAANDWTSDANGSWSTTSNWANGSAPNAAGAIAAFSGTASAPRTITLDSNATVGALIFKNANAYTLSGSNTLTLSGSFVSGATANSYMGPVVTVNAGSHLINTAVAVSGALAPLLAIDQGTQITFAGAISGSAGLVKSGYGLAVLSGSNSYTGATSITNGRMQFATRNSLYSGGTTNWTAANISVTPGATLGLNLGGSGEFSTDDLATLLTNLSTVNNNGLQAGSTLALDTTNASGTVTFSGTIANTAGTGGGALGLNKLGAGTLALTAANTYTGVTTLSGGLLNLGVAETAGTSGPLGKSAAANAGSIVLAGGTLQYSASNSNDYSGRFSTAASQAYNVDTNGQNVTWATALTSSGGSLAKSGSGTLTLNATNTYTGATSVNGGVLLAGTANAFGSGAALAVNAGTVNLGGFNQAVGALSGSAGTQITTNTASGTATLTTSFASGTSTFAGVIADNGSGKIALIKSGNGTQILSGTNTYTGNTTVSSGTLSVTGAYTGAAAGTQFYVNGGSMSFDMGNGSATYYGDAYNYSAQIGDGATTGQLTLQSGTLNILTQTGAGTLYGSLRVGVNSASSNGTLTVNGGTLNVDGRILIGANNNGARGTLTINGGQVNLGNPGNYSTVTENGVLRIGQGIATVNLNGGTLSMIGALNGAPQAGSAFNLNGGTLKAVANNSDFLNVGANMNVVVKSGGATIDDGGFAVTITKALLDGTGGGLTKQGAGTLTLAGASTYTGTTTVNSGVLRAGAANVFGSSAPLALNSGTVNLGGFNQAVGALSGSAGTQITTNTASGTATLTTSFASGTSTFGGVIANNGSGLVALTKGGAGTLNLTGSNTFTGTFTQNGGVTFLNRAGGSALFADGSSGTIVMSNSVGGGSWYSALEIGGSNQLGSNVNVTFSPVNIANGYSYLVLKGNNTTIGNLSSTANYGSARGIIENSETNAYSACQLTVTQTVDGTFAGEFRDNGIGPASGSIGLTKNGAATLTLTGGGGWNIGYSGLTYINSGTLRLDNATGFRSNTTIASGATLALANTGAQTIASVVSGSGNVSVSSGIFTLTGAIYSGSTYINSGTLRLDNATGFQSNTTIASGATLALSNNEAQTIASVVSGSGNVSVSSGIFTLSNVNTYSGSTTVSGGKLVVSGSLAGTTSLSVSAGAELKVNGLVNTASSMNLAGTLSGSGTTGAVSVQSGGVLAPDNSPGALPIGTLTTGSLSLAGGGSYTLELNSATGTAGTNWDQVVASTLDLSQLSSSSSFTLNLQSLGGGNTPWFLPGFDPAANYTWAGVIKFSSLVGSFSNDKFTIDTTNFWNTFNGSFSLVENGNQIDLKYLAIPEPSVVASLLSGLGMLLFLQRRRRK